MIKIELLNVKYHDRMVGTLLLTPKVTVFDLCFCKRMWSGRNG